MQIKPRIHDRSVFPSRIVDYLFDTVIEEFSPFFLVCDREGRLLEEGGARADYRFPELEPKSLVQEGIPALFGLFPFDQEEELFLPCIGMENGRSVDIHILSDPGVDGRVYVLFLDATRKEAQLIVPQQFLNEAALRSERAASDPHGAVREFLDGPERRGPAPAIDPILLIPTHSLCSRLLAKRIELFHDKGEAFGLILVRLEYPEPASVKGGKALADLALKTAAKILYRRTWPEDILGLWEDRVFICITKADIGSLDALAGDFASMVGSASLYFGGERIRLSARVTATLAVEGDDSESIAGRVEAALRAPRGTPSQADGPNARGLP